jgi:hypothetical protein
MSATSITYNSFSLQDSNFKTSTIRFKHLPEKEIELEYLPCQDHFQYVRSYYTKKEIEIEGTLISDSEANLRTLLDNMKRALRSPEQNLDIGYGSSTIRYSATVQTIDVPDEYYHITSLPYKISFVCQPLGKATTYSSNSFDNITGSTYSNSVYILGSDDPRPLFRMTVAAGAAVKKLKFTNNTTAESVTVSQSFNVADILEVDTDAKTVKVNSVAVDYSGTFVEFHPCTNSFTLAITATGAKTINLKIVYYQSFS